MTTLHDIMDVQLLGEHLANGFVSMRHHPQFPQLYILNYTAKTQYEGMWDEVTRQCRGMVVDNDTDEIVARPLKKFYNYGDDENVTFRLDGPVEVTEKMDGSMITVSTWNDNIIVASRGSFESDHARWAKELLGDFYPANDMTYVFELIHPENRIVVDYGDRKELVLLTIVDNETGLDGYDWNNMFMFDAEAKKHVWFGSMAKKYSFESLTEVLDAPEVENMEGFVVKFKYQDEQRLKIKFAEYVKLHKIMTNFSELAVWEVLSTNGDLTPWLENVPDEFYRQVKSTIDDLEGKYNRAQESISRHYKRIIDELPADFTRKDFASATDGNEYKSPLFSTLDGRDVDAWIWKQIRPRGDKQFTRPPGNIYYIDAKDIHGPGERPIVLVDMDIEEPLTKVKFKEIEDSDEW